ncbi:MAG: AraC family transcriptional regulator [Bacteroidota bacterium]
MAEDLHPNMYKYRRIVEAKLFIDTHYHRKIDLENISDQACFSKYHFLRLFKQAYGKSPHRYLTEVRIGHAKTLLRQQQPVTEVCFLVGFDSLPSFTHLFKREVGMTPTAYVAKIAQHKEESKRLPLRFVPNCFVENFGWDK